jgi:hypothetical protein
LACDKPGDLERYMTGIARVFYGDYEDEDGGRYIK